MGKVSDKLGSKVRSSFSIKSSSLLATHVAPGAEFPVFATAADGSHQRVRSYSALDARPSDVDSLLRSAAIISPVACRAKEHGCRSTKVLLMEFLSTIERIHSPS